MKIGDLVQLSAHGRKLQQNETAYGGWGIITKIKPDNHERFPIQTKWFTKYGTGHVCFSRYEIKKLKPDKKCPRQSK